MGYKYTPLMDESEREATEYALARLKLIYTELDSVTGEREVIERVSPFIAGMLVSADDIIYKSIKRLEDELATDDRRKG